MEVKREGLLITFERLDEATKSGLKMALNTFIGSEDADLQVNVWEMPNGSFTIDIYCESDFVVRRLEEFLNSEGYVLRLTPKKIIV